MHIHREVHGHASPIKIYVTHMCNGCTTYKMQLEWCIRFGEDILTIISMLRVVKSPEFAQLAADFRKARSGEDRLKVILRHQYLLNRLEKNIMANTLECSAVISVGRHKPKSISIISFNARGLENNVLDLGKCVTEYSADVILVQETFLKPNRPRACTPPLINLEASACRLAMTGHGTLIIVSVYLPPKKPLLRSDIETLLALGDAVILFGDLNSKNTDWRCNTTKATNVRHRPEILDLVVLKGVVQNLSSIETVHCLGSDHLPVLLKLGSSTGENQNIVTKTIINWKRVSTALEEVDAPNLNVIPDDIVSNNDIDTAIGALTKHIRSVVKRCQKKVPANSDRRGLPAEVRELIRAKNAALRRANAYPIPGYRSRARALQREVKARVREVKNDNWSDLMEEITPTHKAYWAVAKALKSDVCVAMPALKKPDNDLVFDDQEKAEYIADSIELQCSLNPAPSRPRARKPCRKRSPPKAPGLDGVNNKAIKCFSAPLLALLVAIFNACIKNCHFPEAWKEAVIIGIPKPRKPHDLPTSYRPISLLSGLGKLFEKVLKSQLSDHLLGKGLIINEQFGFRPNHSCSQQTLQLLEHISEGFKRKRKTVAVFFDVAKAFDKVWHAGLIYKLHQLQVPDCLVFIIQQYLTNRHFSFRHENSISAKRPIRAEVPQGSTLSPLLYSAYTNDIPRPQTGVQVALFADDTALYRSGSNFRQITPRLQKAIDELTQCGMIGKKSKMSLRNKCTLYKVCIRPVMTYVASVFAHANPNALYQLQTCKTTSAEEPPAHPDTSGMIPFIGT
ncbi:Probable RNA-directed DNA polymerase from transposon BS [Eumeta japonica]|uniref:Probable RNA-directed DNA polymerase from transposon BS n=1 Tax=Eumeta variegata TaxID=151549 RepID=A0A4C2A337_EUMVA|nr:Probable RNA-directed DNA polymerase from transposon BS [Eumeta japonica]